MKLYHGTNQDFQQIELGKTKPNKDFGRGFYLTDVYKQAKDMALRKCSFEGTGAPVVQEYSFNENVLTDGSLKVKIFDGVSEEWAEFVLVNRTSRGKQKHNYDIVAGPVADDGVVYQINLYMQRIITIQDLVKALEYRKLNNQYYFGTVEAIAKLQRI